MLGTDFWMRLSGIRFAGARCINDFPYFMVENLLSSEEPVAFRATSGCYISRLPSVVSNEVMSCR
jgi:hypothetical protein